MPFIKVYPASKTSHATRWWLVHGDHPHVFFTARWIKQVKIDNGDILKTEQGQMYAARCWVEDLEDIRSADILMIYAEPSDKLRGALVEAGVALAEGIPVAVIGEHPDYGSWQWHPGVLHFPDVVAFGEWCEKTLQERMQSYRK